MVWQVKGDESNVKTLVIFITVCSCVRACSGARNRYVADLDELLLYQKCHDPDCKGYRSPGVQIPAKIISHGN